MSVEQEMKGEAHDKKNVPRNHAVWTEERWKESPFREDGTFDHVNAEHWSIKYKEDVSWIHEHEADGVLITEENLGNLPREFIGRRHGVQNKLLPVERIPQEFVGLPSAHGSGQILIQDFIEAIDTGKLPPNHVWISARYSVAGAVAHESSKREGEMLPVPDFGVPPKDKECIDPLVKLRE
jgi:hypothetical protein